MLPRNKVLPLTVSAIILAATALPAQDILFSDNFNSFADGRRPPEAAWVIVGAVDDDFWRVSGGQLITGNLLSFRPGLTFAFAQDARARTVRDGRVRVEVTMESPEGSVAIAARVRDFRNHYYLLLSSTIVGGTPQRSIEIYKLVNGTPLPLAQLGTPGRPPVNIPPFEGGRSVLTLEFEVQGSTLTGLVNGQAVISATDTEFQTGMVGVGARFVEASFDNFAVVPATGVRAPAGQIPPIPAGRPTEQTWSVLFIGDLSRDEAEEFAQIARNDGVDGVKVLPRGGRFAVFIGTFPDEDSARRLFNELSAEGLIVSGVEQIGVVVSGPPTIPGGNGNFRVMAGSFSTRAEAEALRNRLEATGLLVDIQLVNNSHRVVSSFVFRDRAAAEQLAREVQRIAPSASVVEADTPASLSLTAIRAEIANLGTGATREQALRVFERIEQARTQGLTRAEQAQLDSEIAAMPTEVRRIFDELQRLRGLEALRQDFQRTFQQALAVNDFDRADRTLREWRANDPTNTDVDRLIAELATRRQRTPAATVDPTVTPAIPAALPPPMATTTGQGGNLLLILAAVGVGVLVIGGVGFVLMRRKSEPAPISVKPVPTTAKAPVKRSQPKAKAKPEGEDEIKLVQEKPTAKSKAKIEKEPAAPEVDLAIPGLMQEEVVSEPEPVAGPKPTPESPAPAPVPKVTPVPAAPEIARNPSDTGVPFLAPPPIFEQNFDDEEVGAVPRGWKGTYDYASVKVVQRRDPAGGKCLRFEKRSGTGSAYHSCKFPDATGRIGVEFDFCCEDKNKYLLGFYIEMDEEFRHAVHTIVHKDMSKSDLVTLRLQNESTPYALGGWVHVKFIIDLDRHVIDGYVDEKPVVVGARLPSKPRCMNTLSIRDNLATEGVLLIDNIQIYPTR